MPISKLTKRPVLAGQSQFKGCVLGQS